MKRTLLSYNVCVLPDDQRFTESLSVADPGFPVGGRGPVVGCGPLTWALFTKNVCKNERIGSVGGHALGLPPRSANVYNKPTNITKISPLYNYILKTQS